MRTSHWVWQISLAVCLSAFGAVPACGGAREVDLAAEYLPRLERILTENIVPFWYDRSLDREHGGYIISFGPDGELIEPVKKMIVSQARTVWLFSRLACARYEPERHLKAARIGYEFLREKMWDHTHGGFYWQVDVTGDEKVVPIKHLYGQAFGLYAISEYYLASGDDEALDFATRFLRLLDEKAYDREYGGYIEAFHADWTALSSDESGPLGPGGLKLMNTHLHLLEALTTYYRASKLDVAADRLRELIDIETNAVVRKTLGACTDKYDRDWTPRLEGQYARVSYGHDIENVWLIMDACDALGVKDQPFMDLCRTLFAYSLTYGYDDANGGFYYTGEFNEPADNRVKSWWVQAEATVSALRMYERTKDPKYLKVFEQTFGLIENRMVDWETGEWHLQITPDGQAGGPKAGPWKAGYHNGRAMIECIEILRRWRN